MDMWVPLEKKEKEKKKKKQTNIVRNSNSRTERKLENREVFKFFIYSFLSQIYENLTAGFRRDKHEKCSTRRGLRVSTKNTGFHREFR